MKNYILLIEDEPLIQKSLSKLLAKKGANVDAVATGKEAIEKILSNDYDRIICDLMLQDISGFDIIEDSKKKYSSSQISELFIIITAYSSAQVHQKAQGYGCQLITKPFDDINNALNTFLGIE